VAKDVECWYCLQKGHFKVDCPIRKEIAKRNKERKDGKKEEDTANVAEEAEDISSEEEEKAFMAKRYTYDGSSD